MRLNILLNKLWYESKWPYIFLLPFSWIYSLIVLLRKQYLINLKQISPPVPIIVVGNITVGGTGKTPLVIALVQYFTKQGLNVGVVSRGYRANCQKLPHLVNLSDTAKEVGDEPLLIARKTKAKVVISPKRVQAVRYLQNKNVDIIISDDGLQHYTMGRTIEIAVIDGNRKLGNNKLLPAGPLRETKKRLKKVDFIVVNDGNFLGAFKMQCTSDHIYCVKNNKIRQISALPQPIMAIAGIGNPGRFFKLLSDMKLSFTTKIFPDHHNYQEHDLQITAKTVLMTEKDAIKCQAFAKENWYYLPIEANLEDAFWQALQEHPKLKEFVKCQHTLLNLKKL